MSSQIFVNEKMVSSIVPMRSNTCVVVMENGNRYTVLESAGQVNAMIEKELRNQ